MSIQAITSGFFQTENAVSVVVTGMHFGNIYTFQTTIRRQELSHQEAGYNVGLVRWPDGNSEDNENFDLTFENFSIPRSENSNDDQRGLVEYMAYAREMNLPFSLTVPTRSYLSNIKQGQKELEEFLVKLLNGWFGDLPKDFILEIGNESFSSGWVNGIYFSEGSYGQIANGFLTTIREVLNDSKLNPNGVELNIAVQSGLAVPKKIIGEIDQINLENIDTIVSHHLEGEAKNIDIDQTAGVLDAWTIAIGHSVDQFFSAWNVGKSVKNYDFMNDPKNVVGVDINALLANDIGARQASGTISTFSQMIAYGADAMSLWGVVHQENYYFWNEDRGPLESTSHGGEALRLMNESLVGTNLLSGTVINGEWSQDHTTNGYDSFAYEDDVKIVLFLTVGEIKGNKKPFFELDLEINFIWAESIRTEISTEYLEFSNTDYERLFEQPVISRSVIEITDSSFSYTFTQDYEVVRLIIAKNNPGKGYLHLWGDKSDDRFVGGRSDDLLEGNGGNDHISGGNGNDFIFGGFGKDLLQGGRSNDEIVGGNGDDKLNGNRGQDIITDGSGRDIMRGGRGKDIFILVKDGERDILVDYAPGKDLIDISLWGVHSFDDLLIKSLSSAISISYGSEELVIRNISIDDIDASSFHFLESTSVSSATNTIIGTDGDDRNEWRLVGTNGQDRIVDNDGRDELMGKGGADVFVLVSDGKSDEIRDFTQGEDLIDISAWGIVNMENVQMTDNGTSAVLRFKDELLEIKFINASDLRVEDFIFA